MRDLASPFSELNTILKYSYSLQCCKTNVQFCHSSHHQGVDDGDRNGTLQKNAKDKNEDKHNHLDNEEGKRESRWDAAKEAAKKFVDAVFDGGGEGYDIPRDDPTHSVEDLRRRAHGYDLRDQSKDRRDSF